MPKSTSSVSGQHAPLRPTTPTLEPPPRTSIDDPGAHDLQSSEDDEEDDHFSDAVEAPGTTSQASPSSPVPVTRLEKVDSNPSYGEVPGTEAYDKRIQDAVPDQVDIPSRRGSRSGSVTHEETTPLSPIPMTVVEKVDPLVPSHGEVPGTKAHRKRISDAVPDQIVQVPASGTSSDASSGHESTSLPGDRPIPITRVIRVDTAPSHGEVAGTEAYEKRREDAEPDVVETPIDGQASRSTASVSDTAGEEEVAGASAGGREDSEEYNEDEDGEDAEENDGFADDFDDFEEGGDNDDFGDFDEAPSIDAGDSGKAAKEAQTAPEFIPSSLLPLLNFEDLRTPEEVIAATEPYLKVLFPKAQSVAPSYHEPLPETDSVFLTERSASLYSQLVAPPPLQPPNWVRSRIRRLFLVSLGVPVDLDEILPASKQKKLILPSTHLSSASLQTGDHAAHHGLASPASPVSTARLKKGTANSSTSSLHSPSQRGSSSSHNKRKGPAPAPAFDAIAACFLCTSTTEAMLANFSEEELDAHLKLLEDLSARASDVLQYWLQRKDGALGDKEAFEGVIENLVKHARKVRK
ncbi:MAG: hypothetical protein M1838_003257 [Thelocarpon superellum]|nr:MAG: hypothetical protein M1838_003257 [Thelocarpon superellum]